MGEAPSHGLPQNLRPLWCRFRATRDPGVRETLIAAAIPLVRKIANRLALRLPPHLEHRDLEAAGFPGLIAAIEAYDPDKDTSFDTYAAPRIRGAILDELRALDPLSRPLRIKARHIAQAIHDLEQELMRRPTDGEVAERLTMPLESYIEIQARLRGGLHVSVDTVPAHWTPSDPGLPGLRDHHTPDPFVCAALHERTGFLVILIKRLPSAECLILILYYFLELNMKDIGILLELSESRVSQIHAVALGRLRVHLRQRRIHHDDLQIEQPGPRSEVLTQRRWH